MGGKLLSQTKRIIIIGPSGTGKSTIAQEIIFGIRRKSISEIKYFLSNGNEFEKDRKSISEIKVLCLYFCVVPVLGVCQNKNLRETTKEFCVVPVLGVCQNKNLRETTKEFFCNIMVKLKRSQFNMNIFRDLQCRPAYDLGPSVFEFFEEELYIKLRFGRRDDKNNFWKLVFPYWQYYERNVQSVNTPITIPSPPLVPENSPGSSVTSSTE
ncbi:hypothetical protein QE152_g3848 [Popillia japonica]|uniref:Uncharacterized protein n=1 Tax=Popillia japonica TaxID=7064 RepID=A0AAW1N2Q2_POPJA